ncbi:proline racemase [Deferribacter autotrophicus]|uniref:Proline racemase n=1 Tax=Deferribacter autotrophicus TaxID=500465 RepID=A0A5A8F905_9BACT|nr:proline racemase family protein [Deferribacter autotrophicus]KAA0259257.1 proline racemase [Deferribacter autotrophicus]
MWRKENLEQYSLSKSKGLILKTIDLHTAGEPLRVIYKGLPEIEASSVLEFRRKFKEKYDFIRRALMWEPRGHADMYGCVLLPPYREGVEFGVIFMHNEGFSTMCGHGILAVIKLAVECGLVEKEEPLTIINIDTPAGIVKGFAEISEGVLKKTYFQNVPSFLYLEDGKVKVDGIGEVVFDIAFGGAFYAYVDANSIGLNLNQDNIKQLIDWGMRIKKKIMDSYSIEHPLEKDLSFLYGVIFTDGKTGVGEVSRNVCIFADGEVDRSPTGTGVSGRLALHYAKREINKNDELIIESVIGTRFKCRIADITVFGDYDAVIPEVEGDAYIVGKSEFIIDETDPLKYGFFLR